MEIKVGDKVLCKKSFHIDMNIYFDKNEYYTIKEIDDDGFYLLCENGRECDFGFNDGVNDLSDVFKFRDHFYTIKQLRKLKLERLYETQN